MLSPQFNPTSVETTDLAFVATNDTLNIKSVHIENPEILVLQIRGAINAYTSGQFERSVDDHLRAATDWCVLDLSEICELSPIGKRALLNSLIAARNHNRHFAVCDSNGKARKELESTGLSTMIPTYYSLDAIVEVAAQ
jgi:anti-anti-sigma factor